MTKHGSEAMATVVEIDRRSIVTFLAWAGALVVALGVAREIVVSAIGTETLLQDLRHFALDSEHALPAFYSSVLLVGSALLLLAIAALTRQTGGREHGRWLLLSLIFFAMAVDEAVSFHEVLIEPLRNVLDTGGIFYFAWVIPGGLAVVAIGLYFLPFVLRLPRRTALLVVLAGAVYVGGALGLELVGGVFAEAMGMRAPLYLAVAIAEEALEIAGVTIFIAALIGYLEWQFPTARLGLRSAKPSRFERKAVVAAHDANDAHLGRAG